MVYDTARAPWWILTLRATLPAIQVQLAGFPSRRDWTPLHELLSKVHEGEWTTYGDLATAIGSHPIAVGQHISRCEACSNAWRVLGADGRPRPNFAWTWDPTETRTCRQVLEDERISFGTSGAADTAQRISGDQPN